MAAGTQCLQVAWREEQSSVAFVRLDVIDVELVSNFAGSIAPYAQRLTCQVSQSQLSPLT